jgi:LPS-assembly protein
MTLARALFLPLLLLAGALSAHAQSTPTLPIEIEALRGGLSVDPATGLALITNGVIVRYEQAVLTADTASVNRDTGEVRAAGNVILQRGVALWRSDSLTYNFKTGELLAETFRTGVAPIFAEGRSLAASPSNNTFVARGGFLTTDDVAKPAYRIRGRRMVIVPGDYFEIYDATLWLGPVPVFYWPYYRQTLERRPRFHVTPGFRSIYGGYLHGEYNFLWQSNLQATVNLDYRTKRGAALGPDLRYDLGPAGQGGLSYYYLHDLEPGTNSLDGTAHPADRHRLWWRHDVTLGDNFTGRAVVQYQSDPDVVRDFFESAFQADPRPLSFFEASKLWPNFTFSALVQPQFNDFFETVERLPDLKLTAARQQLGPLPLFYEGENSAGYFRYQTNLVPRYAAWRADSFHQLLYPQTFFGWLNVTPRAGGRLTYYSEADGAGATTTEQTRWVFNTGAEVSFKASRVWAGATNSLLAVNGLRHLIEPAFNYAYVPEPSARPPQLPQFDTLHPTLRPLPVDFPRFNSLDAIDSENTLRLGLRNKLQTKRAGGVENLVDWDVFVDWRLDRRPDQQTFGDLVSALDLRPRSWLQLNSEVRYGPVDGVLREANHDVFLQPGADWSFTVGHRYLREDPALGITPGNSLINTTLFYRFNENWAVRLAHRYEARDGTLEEQYYTLYRDLRSWTAALTFRIRDDRDGPTDFGVAVTFSLKAFPRFGLGEDSSRPQTLLGY